MPLRPDVLQALVDAFPDSADCQWQTADIYSGWGVGVLLHGNYLPTAEHAYRESVEIAERLSHSEPNRPRVWSYLANQYAWLGDVQWRSAKPEDAKAAYERAMEIHDQHTAEIAKQQRHLDDPNLYKKDRKKFDTASAALSTAQKELEAAEDKWLELEVLREEIEQA